MKKIAQGLEGMDLGALPMAGGGMEAPAAPPEPQYKVIYSPLDGLGKILADLDFKSYLQNHFDKSPDVIAHNIWVLYGGGANELTPGKKGKRLQNPYSDQPDEQKSQSDEEYNATRNKRWERLPSGISIDKITTPEAIKNVVIGGFEQIAKQNQQPGPTAAKINELIKTANVADSQKNYNLADKIDCFLLNVYSS